MGERYTDARMIRGLGVTEESPIGPQVLTYDPFRDLIVWQSIRDIPHVDTTPPDIPAWTGLTFWGREEGDYVPADNGYALDKWIDKSGQNNHFFKVDDPTRPDWFLNGGPNDRAYMSGYGVRQLISQTILGQYITAAAYEMYAVVRVNSFATETGVTNASPAVIADLTGKFGIHADVNLSGVTNAKALNFDTNADTATVPPVLQAEWIKIRVRHESGALYIRIGNTGEVGPVPSGNTDAAALAALVRVLRNSASAYLDADIAEIMIFNRSLSTAERLTIDDYHDTYFFGGCCNTFDFINLGTPPYPTVGKVRLGAYSIPGNRAFLVGFDLPTNSNVSLIAIGSTGSMAFGADGLNGSYVIGRNGSNGVHTWFSGGAIRWMVDTNYGYANVILRLDISKKFIHGNIDGSGKVTKGYYTEQSELTTNTQTPTALWLSGALLPSAHYIVEALIEGRATSANRKVTVSFKGEVETNGSAVPTILNEIFFLPWKNGWVVAWDFDLSSNQMRLTFTGDGQDWVVRAFVTVSVNS